MALVTTVNPMATLNSLSHWMEKELGEFTPKVRSLAAELQHPAVDILENETAFTILMELPGVTQDAIDMKIEKNVLTVKGERPRQSAGDGLHIRRQERSDGPFERSFRLPDSVDTDAVKADLNLGVLTIALLKKEETRPRTIKVEMK